MLSTVEWDGYIGEAREPDRGPGLGELLFKKLDCPGCLRLFVAGEPLSPQPLALRRSVAHQLFKVR
jgi:hypothetical protein